MDLAQEPIQETKAEKAERELQSYYEELQQHFGQNIFILTEPARNELFKEKGKPVTDLLSMRLSIESQIRSIERLFEKDPDDADLEKQISDLMQQDQIVDKLSKL